MTAQEPTALMAKFDEQAFKAIMRALRDDRTHRRRAFGTIELFLAIQSCRAGSAKQLLRDVNAKTFWVENLRLGEAEYSQRISDQFTTEKAVSVLNTAIRLARQNDDHYPGTDHLLLALLDVPDTAFLELLERKKVDVTELQAKLRRWLKFEDHIRPRTRAYELCALIEIALKESIIQTLRSHFGEDWWVKGIKKETRKKCAGLREDEECSLDIECYLYLIDYKEVLEKHWNLFGDAIEKATGNKGKKSGGATGWMVGISHIRNSVMHPSKRTITEQDIDELQEARRIVGGFSANLDNRASMP